MIPKDALRELEAVIRRAGSVDAEALKFVKSEILLLKQRVSTLEEERKHRNEAQR